jgi:hypothetical protein
MDVKDIMDNYSFLEIIKSNLRAKMDQEYSLFLYKIY